MRQLSAILELAGHYRGRDVTRYNKAIEELRRAVIKGLPVYYVTHDPAEEPTHVPDFGHDHRCRCENPLSHGVKRYFSIQLYVEGEPGDKILGDYELAQGRLSVTGLAFPMYSPTASDRQELRLLNFNVHIAILT
jgi:hypothetical protein